METGNKKEITLGLNEELTVVMPNGDRVELSSIDMSRHGVNHLSRVRVQSDFTGADVSDRVKDRGIDVNDFDNKANAVNITSSEGINTVWTHGVKGKRTVKRDTNKQYTGDEIRYGEYGTEFFNFIK